jgi:hypothetical protein
LNRMILSCPALSFSPRRLLREENIHRQSVQVCPSLDRLGAVTESGHSGLRRQEVLSLRAAESFWNAGLDNIGECDQLLFMLSSDSKGGSVQELKFNCLDLGQFYDGGKHEGCSGLL